ncbi:CorA-like Mg2+ transporter protein [Spraguea lophii 42_110]|uniref:CorA-like Mg2+ transporter protein n=1 Tax=Spraguea lophii (strain 42_110) TaxID=1358809 RepID=S7XU02_SPRLO|nr:CorA-like Mg2+ transporter protein [Spraguea lophii 42_110]
MHTHNRKEDDHSDTHTDECLESDECAKKSLCLCNPNNLSDRMEHEDLCSEDKNFMEEKASDSCHCGECIGGVSRRNKYKFSGLCKEKEYDSEEEFSIRSCSSINTMGDSTYSAIHNKGIMHGHKVPSKRNTIFELITIYRRMKKGRNQDVYRMQLNIGCDDSETSEKYYKDNKNIDGKYNQNLPFYDFEKYRNLKFKKYLFFDGELTLFSDFFNSTFYEKLCSKDENKKDLKKNKESHNVNRILRKNEKNNINNSNKKDNKEEHILQNSATNKEKPGYGSNKTFKSTNTNGKYCYWLNIFCPSEEDLEILGKNYGVHDISLNDIREGNTEEKVEIFKQYIFISLKISSDKNKEKHKDKYSDINKDLDFNILLFDNFIITTHNKPWTPVTDILNFVYLISVHTTMHPEWVFFSVIIEFVQDVKYIMNEIEPDVLEIENITNNLNNLLNDNYLLIDILKKNFKLVYKVYTIQQFIKYKIHILTTFKVKLAKKIRRPISRYLQFSLTDFIEIEKDLKEFNRILERSQDLYLALANLEHSKKESEINTIMKRFAFIAFILLPIQTIAGLYGMNVPLPFANTNNPYDYRSFYYLCLFSVIITIITYLLMTYGGKFKRYVKRNRIWR